MRDAWPKPALPIKGAAGWRAVCIEAGNVPQAGGHRELRLQEGGQLEGGIVEVRGVVVRWDVELAPAGPVDGVLHRMGARSHRQSICWCAIF